MLPRALLGLWNGGFNRLACESGFEYIKESKQVFDSTRTLTRKTFKAKPLRPDFNIVDRL